jgi:hypothetical protein
MVIYIMTVLFIKGRSCLLIKSTIAGTVKEDTNSLQYTGRLMDYWIMYNFLALKVLIPLCMLVHYCLFPMAMIYPGSVLKGMDGIGVNLALIFTGFFVVYFVNLVPNAILHYGCLAYFILSKTSLKYCK